MRRIDNLAEAIELINSTNDIKNVTFSGLTFRKNIFNIKFENCEFICCQFTNDVDEIIFDKCLFRSTSFRKLRRSTFYDSKCLDIFFLDAFIENCSFDNSDSKEKSHQHNISFTSSMIHSVRFSELDSLYFKSEDSYFNYCSFDDCEIELFQDLANFFYTCSFSNNDFDCICGIDGVYNNCRISKTNSSNFLHWFPPICPTEGSFIAYKKIITFTPVGEKRTAIAKLQIPEDAKRTRSAFRKCRCDKAMVLSIVDVEGQECEFGYSKYDLKFQYRVGEKVVADKFDDNPYEVCTHGIHFFMTKREAEDYNWC